MKSVIVIDDDLDWSEHLSAIINDHPSFEVAAKAISGIDGEIMIECHRPDVIIMDIAMPNRDGIQVMKYINKRLTEYRPYIFIITALNTSSMHRLLLSLGVDYVQFKPLNDEKINEALDYVAGDISIAKKNVVDKSQEDTTDIADIIDETMTKIGIPARLLGHDCIKTALYFLVNNPSGKKEVYKKIPEILNTTRGAVDKNIRTAIDSCMQTDLYRALFGKYKASNLDFLNILVTYIEKQLARK